MDSAFFQRLLYNEVTILIPLILAIAVHEWAHTAMARYLGDRTGEAQGRLTLNPLAHIDPIWTVLLPAVFVYMQTAAGNAFAVPFFGAGKPAPYNPMHLDRKFNGKRIHMRTGELLVAAAGPASNVALFVITAGMLAISTRVVGLELTAMSIPGLFFKFALLNVGLAVFNLIPVPPLDGSKILMSLLPRHLAERYEQIGTMLSYLLLALLIFGAARIILAPIQAVAAQVLFLVAG